MEALVTYVNPTCLIIQTENIKSERGTLLICHISDAIS